MIFISVEKINTAILYIKVHANNVESEKSIQKKERNTMHI
jgi:hypothetical protein